MVKRWRGEGSGEKRRVKRHRACASEFDYVGWKGWGRWRRSTGVNVKAAVATKEGEKKAKDCWTNCDYPSQCRWGKRVGIHTPTPTRTEFSIPSVGLSMLNTPMEDMPTLEDCFAAEHSPPPALERALEAGAKRRRSLDSTSPLSTSFSPSAFSVADEQDVEMLDVDNARSTTSTGFIDPALLALTDTSYTSPSTIPPTETKEDEKATSTMEKIKGLLKSHRKMSRQMSRQMSFTSPPVSKQQQRYRGRTFALPALTLEKPLVVESGRAVESRGVFEGGSPLERVGWSKSAVNVG